MTMQPPKNHDSVAGFCLHLGDETIALRRDVCHHHPQRVHDALGTKNEIELQSLLDGLSYSYYFDRDGEYLGADEYGLGLRGGWS